MREIKLLTNNALILLYLWKSVANRYSRQIKNEIFARTGIDLSMNEVYGTLSRLEKRGYICSKQESNCSVRMYSITGAGTRIAHDVYNELVLIKSWLFK